MQDAPSALRRHPGYRSPSEVAASAPCESETEILSQELICCPDSREQGLPLFLGRAGCTATADKMYWSKTDEDCIRPGCVQ